MTLPLGLLPLDDRPVNLAAPMLLAQVAGESLCVPPRARLGRFLTPGQPDALADWLRAVAPATRALIISLDMLAYGGLVASRTPAVDAGDALARLAVLREIKQRYPGLRLLAFNVIMRLTITGADAETRAAGRDIFRYSVLRDQAERLGDAGAAVELAAVEARIPRALLQEYLDARARNHRVNAAALDLLDDGTLDFLALVQEDTAPTGLHVAEQQTLSARATATGDRWRLYAGTDEAGHTLLARTLLDEAGCALPVAVRFRDAKAAEYPALFEDVPLRETTRRHVGAIGGVTAPDGLLLAAHTFTPPQPDLFELPPLPALTWDAALTAFPPTNAGDWLAALGEAPLAVADLAYCNGGDPHLLHALMGGDDPDRLLSYAGWNTAGNTLGTTLAHAAVRRLALARGATPAMERAHRATLLTRLLDDGVYQPIIRAGIAAEWQEFGVSPLNLGNAADRAAHRVDDALRAIWRTLCRRYPLAAALDRPFRATLPWGRLFEVEIGIIPAENTRL